MKLYRVFWQIDLRAESPRAAANKARLVQCDPNSKATKFVVRLTRRAKMDSVYFLMYPEDEIIDAAKTRKRSKRRATRS